MTIYLLRVYFTRERGVKYLSIFSTLSAAKEHFKWLLQTRSYFLNNLQWRDFVDHAKVNTMVLNEKTGTYETEDCVRIKPQEVLPE